MNSIMNHQEYKISGVSIHFPCKPYPSQFSMMDKIIKGIERRQNCLLESPTGSGKSLALLCSTLAWLSAEKAKKAQDEAEKAEKVLCLCDCHTKGEMKDGISSPKTNSEMCCGSGKQEVSSIEKNSTFGWSDLENDDDDFKKDGKKFNLHSDRKGSRNHITISYEDTRDMTKRNEEEMGHLPSENGQVVKANQSGSPGQLCACCINESKPKIKIPKIYFGTRTHKQVAQIVKELKKTAYSDVKMTVLGSREHTCIHPEVSRMKNKNEGCKELLNGSGCRFKDSTLRLTSQRAIKDAGLSIAWDLEDLVSLCHTRRACPYFLARGLKEEADLIICPYNYLVDPLVRDAMQISLNGHLVILDEAHNIEDSAREAASQSISQDSIAKAVVDIESLIEANINLADHSKLRAVLKNLDTFIDENKGKLEQKDFDRSYKIWIGFYIVAQLEALGLGPTHFSELKSALAAVKTDAEERKEEALRSGFNTEIVEMKPSSQTLLEQIFQIMDYLYRNDLVYVEDYRASLVHSYSFVPMAQRGQWLNSRTQNGGRNMTQVETYTLNFWCMNPGVAFSDFSTTRSIILTSGTLSPLTSFESELGLKFNIQLETNHVIKDAQVWVGTLGQGPSGTNLQAVFRNLETFAFQDELGLLVLRVCEAVPYGVLCFLPSYKVLERLMIRWESTGLRQKLGNKKRILSEPRGSDKMDFEEQMKLFYETVKPETKDLDDGSDGSAIKGAVFFAVCRGKVSEGLDFADNFARAVITVGIPYPNFKDIQVELKRQYNDQHRQKGLLSGHDWYEIQAFRALNQALGRCIRHRNDWGALIIVDDRFVKSAAKYCKGLSKWIRNKIQNFPDFSCAMESLAEFTKDRLEIQENELSLNESLMSTPCVNQSPRKSLSIMNSGETTPATPTQMPASTLVGNSVRKCLQNFPIFNFPSAKQQMQTSNSLRMSTFSNTPSAKLAKKMKMHTLSTSPTDRVPLPDCDSNLVTKPSNFLPEAEATGNLLTVQPVFLIPPSYSDNETTTKVKELTIAGMSVTVLMTEDILKSTSVITNSLKTSSWSTAAHSAAPQNDGSKIQLRVVTERAAPGLRVKVFEIPQNLHSVFGGNLTLPVSAKERLVYIIEPSCNVGELPKAKLIKMSEEEKDIILKTQNSMNIRVCNTLSSAQIAPLTISPEPIEAQSNNELTSTYPSPLVPSSTEKSSTSATSPVPESKVSTVKTQANSRKLFFKPSVPKTTSSTLVSMLQGTVSKTQQNIRVTASKSISSPILSVDAAAEDNRSNEEDDQSEEEKLLVRRKSKARKRKSLMVNKKSGKKTKESSSCTNSPKAQVQNAAETVSFKCATCSHNLLGGKLPTDFQEHSTTPPFLREIEKSLIGGSIFFSSSTSRGGLESLTDSSSGLKTKYVEQEEICIQFLYCGQCLKTAANTAEAIGAQVQLAAGSGARFSKGQIWLFGKKVKQEHD